MKVLVGHWGHEANTFAEKPAEYDEYTSRGITFGKESIRAHEGAPSFLGGIIRACREEGIEMVPTCAYTAAAPTLSRDCTEQMLESILSVCRAHKGELDGVCIALHGAGVSVLDDDLETFVLKRIREILGNEIPITVPMDLHGNVSQEMADLTSGLFGIRKYPHTDKEETAYRSMKALARVMRGEIHPTTAVCHLPLLIPIAAGQTVNPPFPELEEAFREVIERDGLVDASLFHGFPYADVKDGTASVVVVAESGAEEAARRLGALVWKKRHQLKAESIDCKKALDLAESAEGEGYVVINEMSDNPGGGCPGDGTHLLREMIRRNLPGSIFGYMVDPKAVEEIFRYRPGDRMALTLGGRHEAIFGEPLSLEVEVIALSDGTSYYTSPNLKGLECRLGKCARVRSGNVDIVVGCARNQTFDDRPFAVTGADLKDYRFVGLKSTQHFRAYFAAHAKAIIPCDPPGLNCGNLGVFEYKKIPRPVFPLDEGVVWDL
ncbi:MAG: M81 family metallopeptidase [Clostridia bacterium]|nr:M81 family metallopeptidase [Clostridia bacterium]